VRAPTAVPGMPCEFVSPDGTPCAGETPCYHGPMLWICGSCFRSVPAGWCCFRRVGLYAGQKEIS
jgi:hypothetical protein